MMALRIVAEFLPHSMITAGSCGVCIVVNRQRRRTTVSGVADKAKHAAQKAAGKIKEGAGRLTQDERLQAEGMAEQAIASVKQGIDRARDALK